MIGLCIVISIVIGVVGSIGICCYCKFKGAELAYKEKNGDHLTTLTEAETRLEIEREKTKQLNIKSDYREKFNTSIPERDYDLEIEKEKTKQLEIKERHYKEHGERLYV